MAFFSSELLVDAFDLPAIFSNVSSRFYYYELFVIGVELLLLLRFVPRRRVNTLAPVQKLTYVAAFTALAALLNIFTFFIVPNRYAVSFMAVPCFLAGMMLGSKEGFAVGFLGDLIGCMIAPAGAYLPLIGLASGLWGYIPGLIFETVKRGNLFKTVLSFILCFFICSAFLTTLANWLFIRLDLHSATAFFTYLGVRAWFQAIVAAVNGVVSYALLLSLKRFLPKGSFAFSSPLSF